MAVGASPQWHPLTLALATPTILNMTHLPARNAASSLRQRAFALLLISLMTAGLLSAPTPAVAATQTISGAVVALELPGFGEPSESYAMQPPWEGGQCNYFSYAYRLKCLKALYMPGFGSDNEFAMITTSGGCATNQTQTTSCYGRNDLAGDGTRRLRPLPVRGAHRFIQLTSVTDSSEWANTAGWGVNPSSPSSTSGRFDLKDGQPSLTEVFCGLTELDEGGDVYCWGRDGINGAIPTPVSLGEGFVNLSSSGAEHQDGSIYIFTQNPPTFALELRKVSRGLAGHNASAEDRVVVLPGYSSLSLDSYEWVEGDPLIDEPEVEGATFWRHSAQVSWDSRMSAVCLVSSVGALSCGQIVPFPIWESIGDVEFDISLATHGLLGIQDVNGTEIGPDSFVYEGGALYPAGLSSLSERGSYGTVCGRVEDTYRCTNVYGAAMDTYSASEASRSLGENLGGDIGDLAAVVSLSSRQSGWFEEPANVQPFPDNYEKLVGNDMWWCAQDVGAVSCAPSRYEQAGFGPSDPGVLEYLDLNGDGRLTVGNEIPLECGVGFECSFEADTMSLSGNVVSMVGTLARTPRTSINISGILRLSDGQPAAGQMEWRSNDGLLRSSIVILAGGRFSLPARTGAGTVSYLPYTRVGDTMGGPAVCPTIGTPGVWSSACTTGYGTVAFTKDFTGSLAGLDLTLPTFAGEQRTLRLQFGDEATGILGARLSYVGGPDPTCEISTTTLGVLRACFTFSFTPVFENNTYGPTANSAGEITLYSPTESDIEYEISTTASDGIQWSDRRVSFQDDGATPDAWVFPGLIFAATPSNMTMARGGSIQVASSVSVDGLDPAFGLAARLVPLSGQVKACSSEAVTSESDAEGDLAFRVCPGASGAWRIVSADGSFFPSAPFTISVPLMVSSITLKGAKISSPFNPAVARRYSGAFTSSTATFAVTLTKAAKKAVVSAARCTRPTSGARTCKVTVKLNGTVETYTFVLNRK